jgi:hypothetical protein
MSAFDSINFNTPEGSKIKDMLEARLQELRVQNDDPGLSEREAQAKRGAIAEVKRLLAGPAKLVPLSSYSVSQRGGTNG